MYRTSLGTRGETRRAAAEAETAVVGRVRRWKRETRPAVLAPHVVVPQWVRGERPVAPPSPVKRLSAPSSPVVPEASKAYEMSMAESSESIIRDANLAGRASVQVDVPSVALPIDVTTQGAVADNEDMLAEKVAEEVAEQVIKQATTVADELKAEVQTVDPIDMDVVVQASTDAAEPMDTAQVPPLDVEDTVPDVELEDQVAPNAPVDALTGPGLDLAREIIVTSENSALSAPVQMDLNAVPPSAVDAADLDEQRGAIHPADPPDIAAIGAEDLC